MQHLHGAEASFRQDAARRGGGGWGVGVGLMSVFRGFCAGNGCRGIDFGGGAGHWAVIISGLGTFLVFPDFGGIWG